MGSSPTLSTEAWSPESGGPSQYQHNHSLPRPFKAGFPKPEVTSPTLLSLLSPHHPQHQVLTGKNLGVAQHPTPGHPLGCHAAR